MDEVLVICPTRDRQTEAVTMAKSFLETSTIAKLVFYVDNESWQTGSYEDAMKPFLSDRIKIHRGPRLGANRSTNATIECYPSKIYGMVPDDVEFKTKGWDAYVVEASKDFKNGIGVMAPHTNFGRQVDMPFCTRGWIDAVGWYGYPNVVHYVWPTVIALLAQCIVPECLVYADPERFMIHHHVKSASGYNMMNSDAIQLYNFIAQDFPIYADKIRAARQ
jgi:hypothetical protein